MALIVEVVADSKFPIDRKALKKKLEEAWEKYQVETEVNLSVAVVGKRKMAEISEKYRGKPEATNVLTFAQQDDEAAAAAFVTPLEANLELGDIVICFPLAVLEAAKMGIFLDERVGQLAVHGLENLMEG